MNAYGYLVISIFFFVGGEFSSKKWADRPTWGWAVLTVLTYGLSTIFWMGALRQKGHLVVLGTLWLLMGTAATVAVGIAGFGETVSARQVMGLIVAVVAMCLLSL